MDRPTISSDILDISHKVQFRLKFERLSRRQFFVSFSATLDPPDCAHGLPDSRLGNQICAPSSLSPPGSDPDQALFTKDRGSIRALDSTVCSVSTETPSNRNGGNGNRTVSTASRCK